MLLFLLSNTARRDSQFVCVLPHRRNQCPPIIKNHLSTNNRSYEPSLLPSTLIINPLLTFRAAPTPLLEIEHTALDFGILLSTDLVNQQLFILNNCSDFPLVINTEDLLPQFKLSPIGACWNLFVEYHRALTVNNAVGAEFRNSR